ncbi:4886_t:CDS:10, partial [Cetraspora pellucida]
CQGYLLVIPNKEKITGNLEEKFVPFGTLAKINLDIANTADLETFLNSLKEIQLREKELDERTLDELTERFVRHLPEILEKSKLSAVDKLPYMTMMRERLDILINLPDRRKIDEDLEKETKEEIKKQQEDGEMKKHLERLEKEPYPEYVKKTAYEEIERYEAMHPSSTEASMIRTYIDWLKKKETRDLVRVRQKLDENHYGLEEVKEKICPPGVGKTSIAKSIAEALGLPFVILSAAGVNDVATVKGHIRTYVGSMPGRIIQLAKKAEVLDPQQNKKFIDNYLGEEIPYDLSKIEKFHIAKDYRIPVVLEKYRSITKDGKGERIKLTDEAIKHLIRNYTREAGVRELNRKIETVVQKFIVQFIQGKKKELIVTPENLPEYLKKPHEFTKKRKHPEIGAATEGEPEFTGNLGDIMKESCLVALDYIRANCEKFGIDPKKFSQNKIRIHAVEGAVPKEGPSAGIALTSAIISALTGQAISTEVGMTGEITLHGHVEAIGGLKEKSIAAHRSGLKTIIIPKSNEKDIEDIPEEVRQNLEIVTVDEYEEACQKEKTTHAVYYDIYHGDDKAERALREVSEGVGFQKEIIAQFFSRNISDSLREKLNAAYQKVQVAEKIIPELESNFIGEKGGQQINIYESNLCDNCGDEINARRQKINDDYQRNVLDKLIAFGPEVAAQIEKEIGRDEVQKIIFDLAFRSDKVENKQALIRYRFLDKLPFFQSKKSAEQNQKKKEFFQKLRQYFQGQSIKQIIESGGDNYIIYYANGNIEEKSSSQLAEWGKLRTYFFNSSQRHLSLHEINRTLVSLEQEPSPQEKETPLNRDEEKKEEKKLFSDLELELIKSLSKIDKNELTAQELGGAALGIIIVGQLLYQKNKVYAFYVLPSANKFQIKQGLEKMFAVKIKKIRTSRQKPVLRQARYLQKSPTRIYTKLRKKALDDISDITDEATEICRTILNSKTYFGSYSSWNFNRILVRLNSSAAEYVALIDKVVEEYQNELTAVKAELNNYKSIWDGHPKDYTIIKQERDDLQIQKNNLTAERDRLKEQLGGKTNYDEIKRDIGKQIITDSGLSLDQNNQTIADLQKPNEQVMNELKEKIKVSWQKIGLNNSELEKSLSEVQTYQQLVDLEQKIMKEEQEKKQSRQQDLQRSNRNLKIGAYTQTRYEKDNIEGKIVSIEYDPGRNCFIHLVSHRDGSFTLIIAPEGLKVNDKITSGNDENVPIKTGNNLPLRYIPLNTPIHNVELKKGKGGQIARGAGTYAEIIGKEENSKYVLVKLPSKEVRKVLADCRATIGKGIRPTTRGSAMNPCDHPHGGKEKQPIGHDAPHRGSVIPPEAIGQIALIHNGKAFFKRQVTQNM